MSNIPGTNVTAPIVPYSELDAYPTHDDLYGRGGYRSVSDAAERDAIPVARRKAGMLVRTLDDNVVWVLGSDLQNTSWTQETIDIGEINVNGGDF
jgi:hypothetical protein